MIRLLDGAPPAEGEAREVASGILWMRLPLPMALDHVDVYALDDGADGWTLVDTGIHSRRAVALAEALTLGPLGGRPVTRVIVTHHHPDHVGMAGWWAARGATLHMPRHVFALARMLTLDVQEVWPDETLAFYRAAGMDADVFAARAAERPFNLSDTVAPLPLGCVDMADGDRLRAGGRDWTVRLGSGHAPDHASLWGDGIVIAGDQAIASISPNVSVTPTQPLGDPLGEWMAALDRLSAFATDDQLVLPGHKGPFRGLSTRLRQLARNHEQALERLEARLDVPRTAGETLRAVFGRDIPGALHGLALTEALAHCHRLWHAGRASRTWAGERVLFHVPQRPQVDAAAQPG
ncbi:MAG: MBL fold metallo-hydrolase [Paracoccaceae bacterium]